MLIKTILTLLLVALSLIMVIKLSPDDVSDRYKGIVISALFGSLAGIFIATLVFIWTT